MSWQADELESLSTAGAEAEALADRNVLADLERAGRRALAQHDPHGDERAASEEAVEQSAESVARC